MSTCKSVIAFLPRKLSSGNDSISQKYFLFRFNIFLCFLCPLKLGITLQHYFKCSSLHFGFQECTQNNKCLTVKQSCLITPPFYKIHVIICGLEDLYRPSDSPT